jgi:hypothetical protein
MDVCHQIPLILGRPFLNTTKSTCMKEFPILTGISFAVPTGSQVDSSTSCRCRELRTKES